MASNTGIIPAGANGSVDVYASNPTDIVIDINGYYAGISDTSGNTALGNGALASTTNPSAGNTAIGSGALAKNTSGAFNTAIGYGALGTNATGQFNIAIGNGPFFKTSVANGTNNILIGSGGEANDKSVIRIGTLGRGPQTQTSFFAAGIRGITTGSNDAIPVLIDSNGQLGTVSSSRRFKEDIHDMDTASSDLLRLRPVTFRYQKPFADGSKPIQYGLIAEEVADVYPDLVARSADGQIETVKYQVLDSMLLNELQKEHQQVQQQAETIRVLQIRLAALEEAVRSDK
jgi:hypothetical protein